MSTDNHDSSVFGDSLLAKKLKEIENNPLYSRSKVTYQKRHSKSSLAGEMPPGDFSGKDFLDSDLYKIINRDLSDI